ncbi:MAG: undecaprenyl-phosphate galactose phosphotransferase WbaP [Anaerolineales bacterium]|nr:undecaprenyl-phosphate galactose phosphotransferase WbaP [Anaerolineales bacterium]
METEYQPQVTAHLQQLPFARQWLLRHACLYMMLLLLLADLAGLALSNLAALAIRQQLPGGLSWRPHLDYLILILLFPLIYYRRRLYQPYGVSEVNELYHLTSSTSTGFIIIGALTYFLKMDVTYSRLAFFITWLFAIILVPLGRMAVRQAASRLQLWGVPVMVIGGPADAARYVDYFNSHPKIGLRPVGVFTPNLREDPTPRLENLRRLCRQQGVYAALVVCAALSDLDHVRETYREIFERIILIDGEDDGLQLSGANVLQFGGIQALVVRQNLLDPWAQRFKRLMDLIASALGLLVLAPFFVIVALLIRLDSPGGVFYRQWRLGKGGRPFQLLKFRTMHLNADQLLQTYLEKDPLLKQEWDAYQKLKHDPRITRMGRLLRRFSLDEFPQLWNVLKGEMSLVGPRPIMLNQVELYGPRLEHYQRVLPGITGIWQVSGRNHHSFQKRAEFDVQYVMNWSVWLDIYLVIRTLWVVLRADGAA